MVFFLVAAAFLLVEQAQLQSEIALLERKTRQGEVVLDFYVDNSKRFERDVVAVLASQLATLGVRVENKGRLAMRSSSERTASQEVAMGGLELPLSSGGIEEGSGDVEGLTPTQESRAFNLSGANPMQADALAKYFQNRERFVRAMPTQSPLPKGLSAMVRPETSPTTLVFQSMFGLDVVAGGDGSVHSIERDSNSQLYSLRIQHEYGYWTEYVGLLDVFPFQKGNKVRKGDRLGSSSDRLRYRVKLGGVYKDPTQYLF